MCASMALVPIVLLYVVSITTPLHIFVQRYCAVAVPGIVLTWAWLLGLADSQPLRALTCAVLVGWIAYSACTAPRARAHSYTWKYALAHADAEAAKDSSPLVICSDLPESNFETMPVTPGDSFLFSPLSYYKVHEEVIPLPRDLNDQAQVIGKHLIAEAATEHKRFLVLGFRPSYSTLNWLVDLASTTFVVRQVGTFDGIAILEFDPRNA